MTLNTTKSNSVLEKTNGNSEEIIIPSNIQLSTSGDVRDILYQNISSPSFLIRNMGNPHLFDYTNPVFSELPIRDITFMQNWNEQTLRSNQKEWGIAGYLEDRSLRLRGTHLLDEGRVYHLGLDIVAPADTDIFSPLTGEVIESTIESGNASYGGYVIIRYEVKNTSFYVLYGHLDPSTIRNLGSIESGEVIGKIGSPDVNGGWTTHLHMQAFTGLDFKEWKLKGYCTKEDKDKIYTICPDPSFLLRYSA